MVHLFGSGAKRIFGAKTPRLRYCSAMARPKVLGENIRRLMISLPQQMAEAVDEYRFSQRIRTEADAIRQLIEAGLKGAQVAPPGASGGSSKPGGDAERQGSGNSPPKAPARKPAPRAKAAAMSKEAQLRALREQGSR
jgi:hypothetical protein